MDCGSSADIGIVRAMRYALPIVWVVVLACCSCARRPTAVLDVRGLPHLWRPTAAAFSGDGSLVAAYGGSHAGVWDADTGRRLAAIRADVSTEPNHDTGLDAAHAAISPDARLVALPATSGAVVWNWRDERVTAVRLGLGDPPAALAVDNAGRVLGVAGGPSRSEVRTVDDLRAALGDGEGVVPIRLDRGDVVAAYAVSPALDAIAVQSHSGYGPFFDALRSTSATRRATARDLAPRHAVRLHGVPGGEVAWQVDLGQPLSIRETLAFSPDGRFVSTLAPAADRPKAVTRRRADGAVVARVGTSGRVVVSADGRVTARTMEQDGRGLGFPFLVDGRPQLRSTEATAGGRRRRSERPIPFSAETVALSPDGRRMLDAALRVWDAPW